MDEVKGVIHRIRNHQYPVFSTHEYSKREGAPQVLENRSKITSPTRVIGLTKTPDIA